MPLAVGPLGAFPPLAAAEKINFNPNATGAELSCSGAVISGPPVSCDDTPITGAAVSCADTPITGDPV